MDNAINATCLKLPEFWKKSPEVWFARVEAQFTACNITTDQTNFDHLVSISDIDTVEEMQAILTHSPAANKYETLKTELIRTYGKSQLQKDFELLSLDGLGDRRSTALMRKIMALNDDPKTLKTALFLANLPSDLRTVLLSHNLTDLSDIVATANKIWEAQRTSLQHTSQKLLLVKMLHSHSLLWTQSLLLTDYLVSNILYIRRKVQQTWVILYASITQHLDQMLAVVNLAVNLHLS